MQTLHRSYILSDSLISKNIRTKINRTIILPVVYRCETWSLTLRERCRLGVVENRALRISGPKRDEVTEQWKRLHNKELYDLNSPTIV